MEYLLITGASSGIGREIAILASAHYPLIINGRDMDRLKETQASCSKAHACTLWPYDLSDSKNLEEELSQYLVQNKLSVSGFVHAAGNMKTVPLKMVQAELFENTFAVNIIAAALISKVLSKKKINQDLLRHIVFISSNISNFGAKAFSSYAASKGALDSLMRCLAIELAPRVRVNSVLPGAVQTPMTEHLYENEELITRMSAQYPLGLGYAKDIYHAVSFLLSEDSRWITGQQITVDGGRTINISG